MTTRLRVLLLLTAGLCVLILGVFLVSQSPAIRRHALAWAETRLTEALGREVRVETVRLQPWLGRLELSRVQVASDRSVADGVLFSAEAVRARWSWRGLLRRHLVLRQIRLIRPRLTLQADGASAVTVQDALSLLLQFRGVEAGGWVFRLQQAILQDGEATWGEADGTRGTVEGLRGELTWKEAQDQVASAAGMLHAARLRMERGGTIRQLDRLSLQVAGTADTLSITAAEFHVAGARVTVRGRIANPGTTARLDLALGVQASLDALLATAIPDKRIEGTLTTEGQLQGSWEEMRFRGEGTLQFGKDHGAGEPLRFSLRWEKERVEAEALASPSEPAGSLRWRLAFEPATRAYRVRASVANTNLATLAGLPGAAVALAGAKLPSEVQGRLTADVDLLGRGADLTTLRGRVRLRVEGLILVAETPPGHLEARLTATTSGLDVETFTLRVPGGDLQGRGNLRFASGKLELPLRADLRDVGTFARGFGFPFLGGRATLQGRLVGRRDAPRLQGRLTWREPRIASQTFDLVEGDVEVAPRTLTTSRLTLRAGRTTATLRGGLVASGTTPLRNLDPKRDLTLDVQGQVNPARTADLIALLPDDLEVQGAFRASGRLTGNLQALTGEVELALENFRTWEESWQRGEALLRFRQGAVEITRLSLRRDEEQLTGEIGVAGDGTLRGTLMSTVMDLARVGSLSGSQLTGRASFRLDLQGTLRETRLLGQATPSALVFRGIPLGPGTATFKVERKAVDVDLTFRDGTHRLQASIGPPPNRSLRAELSLRDADLDLVVRLGEIEAMRPWQGRGSGRILIRGPAGDFTSGTGEADLGSLRLRIGNEVWQSQGPVRAAWSGPTLTLRQLRLRSGEREFDIRGTLGEGNHTDLLVTGQLPLVALGDFLAQARPREGLAIANLRLRGARRAPEMQGTLEIQRGRLTLPGIPTEFREVQATLDIQGNRTEIRGWQAQLAEGSFRGTGEIRRRGEHWNLQITFQEDNGRAEQLLTRLSGGKGEVTGALSLGGILASEGEEAADFWPNLDGDLKLLMRDGKIGRYTVLAKILSLLNVAQLLELKVPELLAEGMPYKSLTADIKIERGIARTENLILDSQAMKVNAVGQVNFVNDTVDLTVAVKPLQTVDRILTKIPLAGWLLGGKEQSLLVAYYQVSGPLSDPQVEPIPLKSVSRNVFGIFRRLLDIPEALLGPLEELPPQPVKPDGGKGR